MKKAIVLIVLFITLFSIVSCGSVKEVDDYDTAIIDYPGESRKIIEVANWRYCDNDMIQITDEDGRVWLVHASNCILVKD